MEGFHGDFLFRLGNFGFDGSGSRTLLIRNQQCLPANPFPGYEQLLRIATSTPDGSEKLRKILFPSFCFLMADKIGQHIFEVLLQHCEIDYLFAILQKFSAEKEGFLKAAFCEPGSRSIQRFITKIKNTCLENAFTNFLAEFARPEFMTHPIASHVVRQCFVSFGEEANEVLHDRILEHLDHLAIHPVGCVTIKASMDSPRNGTKRFCLPLVVAHKASQLSEDRWGNFVVQNVLNLGNEFVSTRVCISLKGEFVELAKMQGGSRVVEKCLETDYGRVVVLDEIFKNKKTLLMLARDSFGNYVVQTALKVTRMHDQQRYQNMVRVLKPRHQMLIKNVDEWFEKNVK